MASTENVVMTMVELSLDNPQTSQRCTLFVPENVRNQCSEDTSGVIANIIFQKIAETYDHGNLKGGPKQIKLGYLDSLKILSDLNLLTGIASSAEQAKGVTIGKNAAFDGISHGAYAKDIPDETLQEFSRMAPRGMSATQNVRFMEILATCMPEGTQSAGHKEDSPNASTQSDGDTQDVIGYDCNVDTHSAGATQDVTGANESSGDIKWTHEAVLMLIERRRELHDMFENNAITQRQGWRKVAQELQAKGHQYTESDCSKKFRSLKSRHKTIKDKNKLTGNCRQTWRYFDVMEDMFAGDPAVLPQEVVSSMKPSSATSTADESLPRMEPSTPRAPGKKCSRRLLDLNEVEEPTKDEHSNTTLCTPAKRRPRSRCIDLEEAPQWLVKYQEQQQNMHDERMALERRRVTALETLVTLLQEKQ